MKKISLKQILFIFWAMTVCLFFTLFLTYAVNILQIYRQKNIEDSQIIVEQYAEKLGSNIKSMIGTINGIYAGDVNFNKLQHSGLTEFEWYGTAYLLQNTLSSYVNSIDYMGAMYYYELPQNTFRFIWNDYTIPGNHNLLLREAKKHLYSTLSDYRNEGYFEYENNIYYSYSYGVNGKYVGGLINLSLFFEEAGDYDLAYVDKDGVILPVGDISMTEEEIRESILEQKSHQDYLMVQADVPEGNMKLLLIREQKLLQELFIQSNLWIFMLSIFCILVLLFFALFYGLKRVLFQPVEYLSDKFNSMVNSNESTRPMEFPIIEFENINQKIEQSLMNIIQLQEEKYKEQLRANSAQLQYYQLQVSPHFYLNCMNTVDSLLENGRENAARELIYSLSSHFRYVFQSQISLVKVEEELKEIQAYCRIYSLKSGAPVFLNIDAENDVMEAAIPILSIQTFVENSIKHVVKSGLLLNIGVHIRMITNEDGRQLLYIRVTDNGDGYPLEALQKLNEPVTTYEYRSRHVGIDNLKYRIQLLYSEDSQIRFSNAPFGGAVTELILGEAKVQE